MNLISNLSIKNKLLFVFMLVVFFEIVISFVGIFYIQSINSSLGEIVDSDLYKIALAYQVKGHLSEIHRVERNAIIASAQVELDRLHLISSQNKIELSNKLNKLRKMLLLESNQKELNEFEISFSHYQEKLHELGEIFHELTKSIPDNQDFTSLPGYQVAYDQAVALMKGQVIIAYEITSTLMDSVVTNVENDLNIRKIESDHKSHSAIVITTFFSIVSILIGLFVGLFVMRSISTGFNKLIEITDSIAQGNLNAVNDIYSEDEIGKLAAATRKMQTALQKAIDTTKAQDWLKMGIVRINNVMSGELNLADISTKVITEISEYLDAQIGAFYLYENNEGEPALILTSTYAYKKRNNLSNNFKLGEGLVGQAALEKTKILLKNVPEDYIKITSGLGEIIPQFICVIPFLFEDEVIGVIEIGKLSEFSDLHIEYLNQAMMTIAINIVTTRNRVELAIVLQKSQTLAVELQKQKEELNIVNEEREKQALILQQSEEKLRAQQEVLKVSNEELAIASKYKSEFLANMSHELRTPLNSLLILSKMLADNKKGNLDSSQRESAEVIYKSSNDLLQLINEVLDLSKIEAGRMDINIEKVKIKEIAENISNNFKHMLKEKGLSISIDIDSKVPEIIFSDNQRLQQIIKNLMSNAIKFTKEGGVTIDFKIPGEDVNLTRSGLTQANSIAIAIKDSGIGISADKQKIVFEAFQQAEGGTSRDYGGTGLGLSISRELANLLGGEIQVESEKGKGSTFTLYLPQHLEAPGKTISPLVKVDSELYQGFQAKKVSQNIVQGQIPDDLKSQNKDKKILIVDDDMRNVFALSTLLSENGFILLKAENGLKALEILKTEHVDIVLMDIMMPEMDGYETMRRIRSQEKFIKLPIIALTAKAMKKDYEDCIAAGASDYLPKPVDVSRLFSMLRVWLYR